MYALSSRRSLSNQYGDSSLFPHFSLIAANEPVFFRMSAGVLRLRERRRDLFDAGE